MNSTKTAYQAVQNHEPGQMPFTDMLTLVCISVVVSVLIVVSVTAIIILKNKIKNK